MVSRRAVTAFLLVQLIAFAISAQQSAEFGRGTGGEIVMTPKGSSALSGSLSASIGNDLFGRGNSTRYGLTAGGALVRDRLWFFASASQEETSSSSRFADLELPENATTGAVAARVDGQIGSAHDFSAFFDAARRPELSTTGTSAFVDLAPSSFLSLRYTGVVSNNTLFDASVTRSSRTVRGFGILPAQ
ncbi:MAG TPA: hypothetical protein VGQ76_10430 [Thermoanaerobaculia bacterium]|jgi:hypothetical protein|nr:hypothetical protein [Thermoanaerobaculia bacterium]